MPKASDARKKVHSCSCGRDIKGAGPFAKHLKTCSGEIVESPGEVEVHELRKGGRYRFEYKVPEVVVGKFEKKMRFDNGSFIIVKTDDGRTVSVKRQWITKAFER